MRGLFIKDLYIMRQNLKSILFILVVWGIVFLPGGGTFIIPMFTMVAGGINSLNLFSYDRQSQWDIFLLSLPIKRSMVPVERYAISTGMTLLSSIVAVAAVVVAQVLMHGSVGSDMIYEIVLSWLSGIMISFLYLAIVLPLTFWLGVEKARMIPTVLLGVLFFGFLFLEKNGSLNLLPMKVVLYAIIGGGVFASVLVLLISIAVSIKIYKKKEF